MAAARSPDDFGRTVEKYRINRDAKGVSDCQRRARSVKFFKAGNGCVGMRVILPTLEGEQLKATLNKACDTAWRAADPDRAETIGGHDDETRNNASLMPSLRWSTAPPPADRRERR